MLPNKAEAYRAENTGRAYTTGTDRSLQRVLWALWALAVAGTAFWNWRADVGAQRPINLLGMVSRRFGARWNLRLVDASIREARGETCLHEITQHDGEGGGHKQCVATRHLRHHHHRCDGHMRRSGKNGSHANDDERRHGLMADRGARATQHGSDEKAGREDSARAAGAHRETERDDLGDGKRRHRA